MKTHDETKAYYVFGLSIGIVTILFMVGNITGLFIRNNELVNKEILRRARSHFDNIKLIREWNTNYGGVWVKDGESPGDDKTYIRKDPALMAREIFKQGESGSLFSFQAISLSSLNSENRPDDFEKEALRAFSLGATCAKDEDQDADGVLKRADVALYRAKDAGRDRVVGIE
ncbi:DUF3365 domain-containing protein [bacterium]|nr:DUF3365 domain-containing protein [bacterium]